MASEKKRMLNRGETKAAHTIAKYRRKPHPRASRRNGTRVLGDVKTLNETTPQLSAGVDESLLPVLRTFKEGLHVIHA